MHWEGNGNPLQCSGLENPRDGGAWWAAVSGVAQSRQPTRLSRPWDSPGKNTGVGCHFLLQCMKLNSESEVTQSCPTLSDPMDCSLPGSSIHGIFQARVLEWGAITFSDSPTLIIIKTLDRSHHGRRRVATWVCQLHTCVHGGARCWWRWWEGVLAAGR